MGYKLFHFVYFFNSVPNFDTICRTGAVGAGAGVALRYGSGSDQMMRLLAAQAPQHWLETR
jgi:hypothetical protein